MQIAPVGDILFLETVSLPEIGQTSICAYRVCAAGPTALKTLKLHGGQKIQIGDYVLLRKKPDVTLDFIPGNGGPRVSWGAINATEVFAKVISTPE